MKAELRADGLHISGYVNVPGRTSRPLRIGRETMNETIEQGAFTRAIEKNPNISMLVDHNHGWRVASVNDGTLKVREDAIGLYAESVITDKIITQAALDGRLKGWSFNMMNVVDNVETREGGALPLRTVKDFDMTEISIILDKIPAYASTSVEVRDDSEDYVEFRAHNDVEFVDILEIEKKAEDERRAQEEAEVEAQRAEEARVAEIIRRNQANRDRLNAIIK